MGWVNNIKILSRLWSLFNVIKSMVKGGEKMDADKITTISGLITAVAGGIAVFFGGALGDMVTQIASGVALIFVAVMGYFINKPE